MAGIVGPTGVGKSRLAVKVAKKIGGEVVSCDSMQVYRGLNIGTAKISKEEQQGVPHHMIDVVEPDEPFSVSDYQRMAVNLIREINERGNIPILVGGTGLYYQAVVDMYDLKPIRRDEKVRRALEEEAELFGTAALHRRLASLDPEAASRISENDKKRIVRALEVITLTGQKFSGIQRKNPGYFILSIHGLTIPREKLYRRLEERVDEMLRQGFVEEVRRLVEKGCGPNLTSMQALGYSHLIRYLEGLQDWETTVYEIKRDTRRYAKRQLTWFRKDNRIKWWNLEEYNDEEELVEKICSTISRTMLGDVE